MSDANIKTVRDYIATDEGRRELRRLMQCFGLSYVAALAQLVVTLCGVTRYEEIASVVDEIACRELATEVPAAVLLRRYGSLIAEVKI